MDIAIGSNALGCFMSETLIITRGYRSRRFSTQRKCFLSSPSLALGRVISVGGVTNQTPRQSNTVRDVEQEQDSMTKHYTPVDTCRLTIVNVAEQNVINKKFVWEQADQSNLIRIFDSADDLIAEYSRSSGAVRWKRAASAVDKDVIERFLEEKFGEEVRKR